MVIGNINCWAVLIAAVVNMVVGSLWFGPLFGGIWMKLSGVKRMGNKNGMTKTYILAFIGAFVMAFVLAYFVYVDGSAGWFDGLLLGFWIWLGFVVTVMLGMVLWEGRSWKLYFLNIGYYLVVLLINGSILAAWR